jgi:hypothetical protein
MMKKTLLTTLTTICFSTTLLAGAPEIGYHQLVCYNEIDSKKISIMIDGVFPDKFSKVATVKISKGIDISPYQVVISSSDNAKVEDLVFNLVETSEQYIKKIKLNMGRSGELTANPESVYGESLIKSSLREFYFPANSKVQCNYSFIIGPRPISGGN